MTFDFIPEDIALMPEFPEKELTEVSARVGELLIKRGMKIAPAESCTGGLIAKILTDIPGSSNFFECGIVSYSDRIKHKVLGVETNTLEEKTAVSPEVAAQMAYGIQSVSNADVGISVTGVAGPGADGEHPEGEIYIGICFQEEVHVLKLMTGTKGKRDYNRKTAALNALSIVYKYLTERK